MSVNNIHGVNKAKKYKCSICGQEYTIYDPKNPNRSKDKKTFRFPDEWNEDEILAHRISHIESPKVKRIVGKLSKLTEKEHKEIINFIDDLK